MPNPVVVIAESGGPLARAATRAGYEPFVIDTLGCHDGPGAVCAPGRFPFGVLDLIGRAPAGAPVLLGGPMENHPDLVDAVAKGRELLGSSTESMRAARHPDTLATLPPFRGLRLCKTKTRMSLAGRIAQRALGPMVRSYLLKPRYESGGRGIRAWSPGDRVDETHYLQQRVEGTPMSAVYHADGWSCQFLGLTRMLVGASACGAAEFAWCGSIGPDTPSDPAKAALQHLGVVLTQRLDLRGVFGADLVMDRRGNLWPVEVNPRYTESMEVLERATGRSVLTPGGKAPKAADAGDAIHGKAAVFAKQDGVLSTLPDGCIDARHARSTVKRGERIACVVATGQTVDACAEQLALQAAQVHDALGTASPAPA